jgi:hypothetical protein
MARFARITAAGVALLLVVTAAGVVAAATGGAPAGVAPAHEHAAPAAGQTARDALRAQMRKLWEDHITWTRLYIVSAATLPDDLPDIGPTAERLFANQDDIGAAVGSFYGQAAGNQLTALLHEHIALAAQAITAAKAGDDAGLQQALDDWYANADDIARFLADANPRSWPFEAMSAHMRDHLDHTLAEAVARLNGDYAADIAAYDKVHTQILEMADMLANGIIDAFPARFGR